MYLVKLGDICCLTNRQKQYANYLVDLASNETEVSSLGYNLCIYSLHKKTRIRNKLHLAYQLKMKYRQITKEELIVKLDMEGKKIYVLGQAR